MNITEFLLARIAEDEAVAREALAPEEMYPYGDTNLPQISSEDWGKQIDGYVGGTWGTHAARHNPLRVLRECEAKRAIIGRHRRDPDVQRMVYGDIYPCTECGDADDSPMEFPCPTIKALTAVYSDHQDFNPEWANLTTNG